MQRDATRRRILRALLLALCALIGTTSTTSAAWQAVGPWGGGAELVRVLPHTRHSVLAATRTGALFLSEDGGTTWGEMAFPGRLSGVLHALEVDPRADGTWYIGMEGHSPRTAGVYRTTDAGRTWTLLPGTQGRDIWSLAFSPSNPDVMAAGTDAGVFRSTDAGATWARISRDGDPELRPVVSLAFGPSDSAVLYAGTTHLPWRTRNGGTTWEPVHAGMLDDSDVFSITVDARQPSRVLASACSGAYLSRNGGDRWTRLATPKGAFRVYLITMDPAQPETLFAGTSAGLLRSANSGTTWQRVSPHAVKSVAFDRAVAGRLFFASTDAGLLVSTDGGLTLRASNTGFSSRTITALVESGRALYLSGPSGLFRSDDAARSWTAVGSVSADTPALTLAASLDAPQTLVGVGPRGLRASTDGGQSWLPREAPPGGSRVTSLTARLGGTLLAGTGSGLYRAGSAGGWQRVSPSPVVALQGGAGRIVTAVTPGDALISTDDGATWRTCGAAAPDATWYGLGVDAAAPALPMLAATSRGVFRSTDGCRSWTRVAGGLEQATAAAVLVHPVRSREAFAAQGGAVWRTSDGGETWRPMDGADRAFWPSALVIVPSMPDRLFAAVPGRGLFATAIPPSK